MSMELDFSVLSGHIENEESESFPAPYVHPDERTCTHCARQEQCWREPIRLGLPEGFAYRSGWDSNRFNHHIRGVLGQICEAFEHSNVEINRRHVQAERRRREENGEGNDWDEEVN